MSQKSILIIGAGAAGLCTGIYGQMNGYKTQIVEKHKIPGGLLTAWRRNGYLIDLCIHWLAGSGPGFHLNRYWNEIGLLEGRKFLPYDLYAVYHAKDGRTVYFYCDPDRLEKHLLELSPEDAAAIHELADGVRLGIRFKPPEMEQYEAGALRWMGVVLKMMPLLKDIQKWTKTTIGELAARFKSPLLREALLTVFEPDFSCFFMFFSQMGFMYRGQAGYPVGGSLPVALALEKRYKQLGGRVQYQANVEKILVENERAVGVRFEDGSEKYADVVVSAADGFTTIFKLLDGKFIDQKIHQQYETWKPIQSVIYASVGVRCKITDLSFAVEGNAFELQEPVMMAGEEQKFIGVRVRSDEPGFAPSGKSVITSAIFTNHAFWKALEGDRRLYEAEKEKVAQAFIAALEQVWPGISEQVEMCDVATPLTFERITGNWKASITGWKLTPEQAMVKVPKSLPGLENFWMVGHWVYPGGGIPAGVSTGREIIWKQCMKDGKTFTCVMNGRDR
ncbi:MAG: NAD(P)/FAD-dependent oxidoreductase [Chloroflexi bacterium]|nr:MAG: NAD(P)/FAD-dependent oxidoreductase [Chloroflexota bacterium]